MKCVFSTCGSQATTKARKSCALDQAKTKAQIGVFILDAANQEFPECVPKGHHSFLCLPHSQSLAIWSGPHCPGCLPCLVPCFALPPSKEENAEVLTYLVPCFVRFLQRDPPLIIHFDAQVGTAIVAPVLSHPPKELLELPPQRVVVFPGLGLTDPGRPPWEAEEEGENWGTA